LVRKFDPGCAVTVIERNPADVTYGWGVVFSDRTLASFQRADYKTYMQITEQFVIWDSIDVRYRGQTISCVGHVIAAIERRRLLNILQARCAELGVEVQFGREVSDVADLPECDLLVAADGVNSAIRRAYEDEFGPSVELGKAKYIWLGVDRVLDAFNFIFHENEHGLFQVHAYPFSGTTSTFIVECDEPTWHNAGLDEADEAASLAYCQRLLDGDLGGARLMSNNSKWINFPTLRTRRWHIDAPDPPTGRERPIVLVGDAAHTAHFSIGAGTKLAMEDAIALAGALEQHDDLGSALNAYEAERKPVVETFQRAAHESRTYFEGLKRYLVLDPVPFAFQLLTRSGRITYDDLRFRDAGFGALVDRWFAEKGAEAVGESGPAPLVAPEPLFALLRLREQVLANRVVTQPIAPCPARDGVPAPEYLSALLSGAERRVGLVVTEVCAVSPEGRATPADSGLYSDEHTAAWSGLVREVRERTGAALCVQIGHAGRRGATRPRSEGLDRPLREGAWPLLAPSPLPHTPASHVPREMDRDDMDAVREAFVRAAQRALEAGFDLLQVHMAHGYLLASFLSPLTNKRDDEYGGEPFNRARYPLEVFDAVREVWPQDRPLAVALSAGDFARNGATVEDAVVFARLLKAHGCDLVTVLAGYTVPYSELPYGKGFLVPLSDRIRNEAGILTVAGGYLTTSNEINTALAAGRADLCILDEP
jgi:anthraniloyl-CoA monooxygenase